MEIIQGLPHKPAPRTSLPTHPGAVADTFKGLKRKPSPDWLGTRPQ